MSCGRSRNPLPGVADSDVLLADRHASAHFRFAARAGRGAGNVAALLALPNVRAVAEQDGFLDVYRHVTVNLVIRGNAVPDAQLAAILFQDGVRTLYTRDRDFRKFEFFDVRDPFLS